MGKVIYPDWGSPRKVKRAPTTEAQATADTVTLTNPSLRRIAHLYRNADKNRQVRALKASAKAVA
jgi:hypothetical protein